MFTGIVEELGSVRSLDHQGDHAELTVDATVVTQETAIGDSISVNGCCLTATSIDASGFSAQLMTTTLQVTTLGNLRPGAQVNLERAVAVGDRLGGHLVQGHVDGIGTITDRQDLPGTVVMTIEVSPESLALLVPKGSITVDGVSLTVLDTTPTGFTISLIPHTLAMTTLGEAQPGDTINVEYDMIAKHVARLLDAGLADRARAAGN